MGDRSGAPQTEADAAKLSLRELNRFISYVKYRALHAKLSASLRKSAIKRLVWLEAQRERLHGIPAPDRGRF